MAQRSRRLNLKLSDYVNPRLAEIWRWNADKYGEAHATTFVEFLKAETLALTTTYQKGRQISHYPSWRYLTIKKRAKGHGYIVVYEIQPTDVFVLYYFHTAQNWEAKLRLMLRRQ